MTGLIMAALVALLAYGIGRAGGYGAGLSEGYSKGKDLIMLKVKQNAIHGYAIRRKSSAADRDAR